MILQTGVGLFVVLLLVASTVAILVRFVPLPAESALALIGLLVGVTVGPGALPGIGGNLILFILLPGLLFDADFGWNGGCCARTCSPLWPWLPLVSV